VAPAAVLGAVAVGAVLVAWLQDPEPITAHEAAGVAAAAFAAAGVPDARVGAEPSRATYDPGGGDALIEVWRTVAEVDGGTIQLWLAREDAEPVFLDDRTPDGTAQLLTDAQFDALADVDDNPALDRRVRRNLVAALAGAGIVLLAAVLATQTREPA